MQLIILMYLLQGGQGLVNNICTITKQLQNSHQLFRTKVNTISTVTNRLET